MDRNHDIINALAAAFDGGPPPTLLYITRQDHGGKRRDRPIHSHDDLCELLLVYSGCGTYVAEGRAYPLREGDIILANQDTPHEVVSASRSEIGTYCFGFCGVRFAGLPVNVLLPPHCDPVCPSGESFPFLQALCEQAYRLLGGGALERAAAQSLATGFLLMARGIREAAGAGEDRPAGRDMPYRIRRYLDQHYTEPLTIDDIAAAFGCSASYVSHACKASTGYAPIQYVIRRRIGLAQTLLTTTDYSVTRIADLVGYDNPNYFTALFARIVGVSPLRYKEQYLEALRGTTGLP